VEVLKKLKLEYLDYSSSEINLVSQIYSERLLLPQLNDLDINYMVPHRFQEREILDKDDNYSEFQKLIFRKIPGDIEIERDYDNACLYMIEFEVDYLVIEAQYNNKLETATAKCIEKLFEIGEYRVFKIRPEWYNN
jgi:hypothetical protein